MSAAIMERLVLYMRLSTWSTSGLPALEKFPCAMLRMARWLSEPIHVSEFHVTDLYCRINLRIVMCRIGSITMCARSHCQLHSKLHNTLISE